MAAVTPTGNVQIPIRQMSNDFMARRKIYEHEEQPIFYSAVAKVTATKPASEKFSNATPKPVSRKEQTTQVQSEVTPQSRLVEGAEFKPRRISDEGPPNVPRRSSSIRMKQSRNSRGSRELRPAQVFSSLNESVNHHEPSVIREEPRGSSPILGVERSPNEDIRVFPMMADQVETSAMSMAIHEDSPLGFTLARKRTSLPPMDLIPDRRLSLRISKITERDSCISHRDRESFLASFPQPPKMAAPISIKTHRRNSSSQNYSLFPRPSTKHSTTADESTPRQSLSQRPLNMDAVDTTALPMPTEDFNQHRAASPITATVRAIQPEPQYPVNFGHHDMSFPNPNFSNISLHLQLNPNSTDPMTWASATSGAADYGTIGGTQPVRKRSVRKAGTRWLFGNVDANKSAFAERLPGEDPTRKTNSSANHRMSMNLDRAYYTEVDEKFGDYHQSQTNLGLRKKASSLFKLKERTSAASTSNLLDGKIAKPTKLKKSLLRRLMCF